MTQPERLNLLLPWVNGDLMADEIRPSLRRFLKSFVGGLLRSDAAVRLVADASDADLRIIRERIATLVQGAFAIAWVGDVRGTQNIDWDDLPSDDDPLPLQFPSLRFGVRQVRAPHRSSLSELSRRERRAYEANGYDMRVEGDRLRDLVPFLFMTLLTTPGTTVARCPAPKERAWNERCGRFHVWLGKGRPQKHCSPACSTRAKDKRFEDARKAATPRRRKR